MSDYSIENPPIKRDISRTKEKEAYMPSDLRWHLSGMMNNWKILRRQTKKTDDTYIIRTPYSRPKKKPKSQKGMERTHIVDL